MSKDQQFQLFVRWMWPLIFLLGIMFLGISYAMSRGAFMNGSFSLFDAFFFLGAIGFSVYIIKIAIKNLIFLFITGVFYIALAAVLIYFYDYKNDTFISNAIIFTEFNSLFICIMLVFSTDFIKKRQSTPWVLLFLLPVIAGIAGYFFIKKKAENRVEYLLQTKPVSYTTAIVTKINNYTIHGRRSRKSHHQDALLEFKVNGIQVYHIFDNKIAHYILGARVNVKYLQEQPDMFEIIQTENTAGNRTHQRRFSSPTEGYRNIRQRFP